MLPQNCLISPFKTQKSTVYSHTDLNKMFSPQAPCGAVEDIRVYVVVGAAVWPAGEWHHHIVSQGGQRCSYKFPLQLIGGGQVPQQAFTLKEK